MIELKTEKANKYYMAKEYSKALAIYRELAFEIGDKFFFANINACERKINAADGFFDDRDKRFVSSKFFRVFDTSFDGNKVINLSNSETYFEFEVGGYSEINIRINFSSDKNFSNALSKSIIVYHEFYENNAPLHKKMEAFNYLSFKKEGNYGFLRLLVPKNAKSLRLGIRKWGGIERVSILNSLFIDFLKPGVSIVIPTYKGEAFIGDCLNSLKRQTLDRSKWEAVVVINGEKDGTHNLINEFIKSNKDINLNILSINESGAGIARNKGIEESKHQYLTFLDDDDQFSDNYLEELFENSDVNRIALTQILDLQQGNLCDNPINAQIKKAALKKNIVAHDVSSAITMNASKLIPTFYAKETKFNEHLRSGEDVDYWSRLIANFHPHLYVIPVAQGAYYIRLVRDNSVSRRSPSYDFCIRQRLDVIKCLDAILAKNIPEEYKVFAISKIKSQSSFIINFLKTNPHFYGEFISDINKENFYFDCKNHIIGECSENLVISYCFTPYIDTSGVVMAKRIQKSERAVDVVYADMGKVRPMDDKLSLIGSDFIGKKYEIKSPVSFSNWKAIDTFCAEALKRIKQNGKKYKSVYSRAMWPASHFSAAVLKAKNNSIKWVAEFSDPIYVDVKGEKRLSEMDLNWLDEVGIYELKKKFPDIDLDNKSLFYWCEILPYLMADEVIFTNENQMTYMMSYLDSQAIRELVQAKAKVSHHPTLDESFYNVIDSNYHLDDEKINIAYFGSFYETRGLGDVLKALRMIPKNNRSKIKLHVFTQQKEMIENDIGLKDIIENLIVNDYVGYLEFLGLSKKFDVLVVNDASTEGVKIVNPYLPSKFSDYIGSKNYIWAICERNSVMHQRCQDLDKKYISYLGDEYSNNEVVNRILNG
ncbi:glycosyltransferase [Comamonas testosteroni]|uniref:glycosyltransferase n=1 Tax=Comamonas testosteroni TaxID=285 RepID=UPI000A8047F0|nr:glycosyltransferase [Comamonas testosteroni]